MANRYLEMIGDINPNSVRFLVHQTNDAIVNGDDPIILLSSAGGSIAGGITLYNHLKALPVDIEIHAIGPVNSIAVVVFLAGNRRIVSPNATMYFHQATNCYNNGTSLTRVQLLSERRRLEIEQRLMISTISSETGLSVRSVKDLVNNGVTLCSSDLVSKGFAHSIGSLNLPSGTTNLNWMIYN